MVYFALTGTLLLAAISLIATAKLTSRNWWNIPLVLSFAVFIYLYGAWVFLSVYTRYGFAIASVALLLNGLRKRNTRKRPALTDIVFKAALSTAFLTLIVFYFRGTTGIPYGRAMLVPPFRHGNYFVLQGGKGLPTNLFHYKLRTAVHAMDIVKLNGWGNRADRIFSTALPDYAIYNDTILSPCDGRIISCESRNPDNIPPHRKRGYRNINYVLVGSESMYVFLGHLKPGGVLVQPGQKVKAGQPIGICGNSGFSIEPHLHIQAHAITHSGLPWYKEPPLQMFFNKKYYGLFEVIQVE